MKKGLLFFIAWLLCISSAYGSVSVFGLTLGMSYTTFDNKYKQTNKCRVKLGTSNPLQQDEEGAYTVRNNRKYYAPWKEYHGNCNFFVVPGLDIGKTVKFNLDHITFYKGAMSEIEIQVALAPLDKKTATLLEKAFKDKYPSASSGLATAKHKSPHKYGVIINHDGVIIHWSFEEIMLVPTVRINYTLASFSKKKKEWFKSLPIDSMKVKAKKASSAF